MPAKRPLFCPSCGSDRLERIGSNGIEPNAGYTCQGCSQKMRRRGTGWFYAFTLGLGLVMGPVGIGLLIFGFAGGSVRLLVLGGIGTVGGLICFVYSVLRFGHPVPLPEPPQLDYRPPPLPAPPPAEPPAAPTPTRWRVIGFVERTGVPVAREVVAPDGVSAVADVEREGVTVTQVERLT
jgi:hypothetical protein